MVRTDPGTLSDTTVARIDRRGNPLPGPTRGLGGVECVEKLVNSPPGRDPALLLKQEGVPMFSVDLSTRECDGHVVVALGGELDVVDAAGVAAALVTVAAREPEIIVDLAALEFIDSSGVAALARGRTHARQAGGDLLLAAPRQPVLRVLAITGLIDEFSVPASVEEAAASARRSRRVVVPLRRPRKMGWSPPHSRTAEPTTVKDGLVSGSAARNEARHDPAAVVPFPGCGDDS